MKNTYKTKHGNPEGLALYSFQGLAMIRKKIEKLLIIIQFVLSFTLPAFAVSDAPDPVALDQERQIKEDSERQAQSICDSIMGKGQSSVLVSVELGLESVRKGGSALNQKMDKKSGTGDENYLLPWVPAPKSVTKEEVPKDANIETQAAQQSTVDVKTVLKRFDITVVHDDTIPEERVNLAKETLRSAFDRYKGVMNIFFRATKYMKEIVNPKDVVKKNLWDSINLKNLLLLFVLMLAFMLLRFFFGPLADFMKSYIDGMREQSKSKVEMENKSESENESDANTEEEGNLEGGGEGELTQEQMEALQAEEELMKKFEPFKYVTDENIKQLAYLLHHEEPWVVAVVLSYLSSDHAFKVMEALPPDLQAKVALETAMYRQTSLEQVQTIDEDIKQKIDFVVGGLEKLVTILENSDRFSRDNILETLKNEKPAAYEKVREKILLFEDIVNFPKMAMQVLVRELKTEALARALKGVSPELQQKFFENMSQGAVTLLKEEMEYGRPVTDDQIEEERRKIIDLVKLMETEGKISVRQKGKISPLSGMDMAGRPEAPAANGAVVNPEAALESYNAALAASEQGNADEAIRLYLQSLQADPQMTAAHQGLANTYYASGRYQEALAEYDQVLQLEPNEELRSWVEELRASVTANAA